MEAVTCVAAGIKVVLEVFLVALSSLLMCHFCVLVCRLWRRRGWFIWWQSMPVEGKYLVSTFIAFFNQIMHLVNYSKLKIAATLSCFSREVPFSLQTFHWQEEERNKWDQLDGKITPITSVSSLAFIDRWCCSSFVLALGLKMLGIVTQLDFHVAECFASQQLLWTLLMIVELLGCVSSFQRNRQSCSSGVFCTQNHVLSFLFDIWCYLSKHWLHPFQAPLSLRVLAECSWPQELFLKGKKVSVQHNWKNCGLIIHLFGEQ